MALWVKALTAKSLYQSPHGGRIEQTSESGPLTHMNVHAHAHTGTHTRAHTHSRTHTYMHTEGWGDKCGVCFLLFCFFLKKEGSEI